MLQYAPPASAPCADPVLRAQACGLLDVFRDRLDAAFRMPERDEAWDAAGAARDRLVRHVYGPGLLSALGLDPDEDLDRLQPPPRA